MKRKHRIEELEQERDFFRILKETNDVIEKHLNQDVILELKRMNEIEEQINEKDEVLFKIKQDIYSPEIEDEFDNLESEEYQKKVTQSLAKFAPRTRSGISMLA